MGSLQIKRNEHQPATHLCHIKPSKIPEKNFLWKKVTDYEKWIYFENLEHKKQWVRLGRTTITTPKRNSLGKKVIFCLWWDMMGII